MTKNRCFKFIVTVIAVLFITCGCMTVAFAEPVISPGDVVSDINDSDGQNSLGKEESTKSEEPNEDMSETEETKKPTESQTRTDAETKKTTTVHTTRRAHTVNKTEKTTANTTTSASTETTLPEGSFYVYLELNNGQPRMKYVLSAPGSVPEPTTPERKGYIFDGWYADETLQTVWDFATSVADENTVIYAKWAAVKGTVAYNVTIVEAQGGYLQVNPQSASEGEPVIITAYPDDGKRIVAGSLIIDGQQSDVFSFTMPAHDVVISAQFEDVPVTDGEEDDGKSVVPIIVVAVIVVAVAVVTVVLVLKKKASYEPFELDENGAVVIDDDDDDGWVDESIVIEDGFSDGKKARENVEPDYGEIESDE